MGDESAPPGMLLDGEGDLEHGGSLEIAGRVLVGGSGGAREPVLVDEPNDVSAAASAVFVPPLPSLRVT